VISSIIDYDDQSVPEYITSSHDTSLRRPPSTEYVSYLEFIDGEEFALLALRFEDHTISDGPRSSLSRDTLKNMNQTE
jgi:hypothetical protein